MAAGTAKLGRCSFSAFLVLLLLSNPSCAQDASSSQDPATPLPDDTGELVQGKDPSMSASDFLAATQIAPDKIQTIRMRIYQQFVQNLAMQGASTAGLGEIVNLPQPPFTNMTLQLVKLRLSSLVANGFLFHEFFVPPGIQVSTNSELVVLLYNQIPVTFSPYRPPAGYSYTPYFAGIDILPFVNDSTQAPGPLLVRSSPSLPVTVTFPLDDSEHKFVQCTTFGIRGTLIPLNQSQDSTPTRIVCQSVTLGEFTLTIGSRPFPPPPPPPPSPPVSPLRRKTPTLFRLLPRDSSRRQQRLKRTYYRSSRRARDTDYSAAAAGRVGGVAAAAARPLREDGNGGGARRQPRDRAHRGAARAVRARRAHARGAGGRGLKRRKG
ncbi:hypothetical protein CLOP_g24157 [Closterium sp. NIES-67]|nr:hypothetical protein CLOP_g24157 [Closterium sp. NIES-67]